MGALAVPLFSEEKLAEGDLRVDIKERVTLSQLPKVKVTFHIVPEKGFFRLKSR